MNSINERKPSYLQGSDVDITREDLTRLMMESHRKSATAGEEIMALNAIAKLNGFLDTKKIEVKVDIQQDVRKLETLSDEELLQLTGGNQNLFEKPQPLQLSDVVEDAVFVEVEDEDE